MLFSVLNGLIMLVLAVALPVVALYLLWRGVRALKQIADHVGSKDHS